MVETRKQKEAIKKHSHRVRREAEEVIYESEFRIPADFGEIGAVLVENQHHKEIYIQSIDLTGFPTNGSSLYVRCASWVHSKHFSAQKRVFFTNKVSRRSSIIEMQYVLFFCYICKTTTIHSSNMLVFVHVQ